MLVGDREKARDGGAARNGAGSPPTQYLEVAPELSSALASGAACFSHVALAYLFGRAQPAPRGDEVTPEERDACREIFPSVLRAFEEKHGALARAYFARHAFAAAAMTEKDEVDIIWGRAEALLSPECVKLLFRCDQITYAAWHRLAHWDRRLCQNMVFSVVLEVLRRIDQDRQDAGRRSADPANGAEPSNARRKRDQAQQKDSLSHLSAELDKAEDFMLRCATRRAQIRYVKGMFWGAGAMVPLLALTGLLLEVFGVPRSTASQAMLALGAGAIGAVVSVLARMTFGEFSMNLPTLQHDMKQTDVRLIGGVRPLIGSIFALILYSMVEAGLVPLEPPGAGSETFLYIAVGFLAGFSERLAQDMFARSGHGLMGAIGNAPTEGPSAGLSPPPGNPAHPASTTLPGRG